MATITFKGNPVHTNGELPKVGQAAPNFTATNSDMDDISLSKYAGHNVILNIFPSLDTGVCATAMRRFNDLTTQFPHVPILCISADLPFAQQRFCALEHIKKLITLSVFRHPEFAKIYGVAMIDGPLQGLLARSAIVIDSKYVYDLNA